MNMLFGGPSTPQAGPDFNLFSSSAEGPPDYVTNHPFVQSLQAALRHTANQVVKSAETHSQLIEKNTRLKAEVQGLNSKFQGIHAELQLLWVKGAM